MGSEGNVGVYLVNSESGDSIIELQLPRPRYYLSFTPRQYMTVAGYINEATSDARRAADSDDSSAGQGAAVAPWEDSSVDSDVPDLLDRTVDDGSVDNDVPDLDEEGIPDLEEGPRSIATFRVYPSQMTYLANMYEATAYGLHQDAAFRRLRLHADESIPRR